MGLAGIAGPVAFLASVLLAGSMEPGYSHSSQYLSELGAAGARSALVMNGGLLVLGCCALTVAKGLNDLRWSTPVVARLLILAGSATIGAALVHCSPGCPNSMAPDSVRDGVHGGFAALAYGASSLIPMTAGRSPGQLRSRRYITFSLATGLVTVALHVFPWLVRWAGGPTSLGLTQRLAVGAPLLWFFVTGTVLLRSGSPGPWLPDPGESSGEPTLSSGSVRRRV